MDHTIICKGYSSKDLKTDALCLALTSTLLFHILQSIFPDQKKTADACRAASDL